MFSKLFDLIVKGYGLLLSLAAGGLIFANLFGVVVGAMQSIGVILFGSEMDFDPRVTQSWIHRGWFFGVSVALTGDAIALRKHRRRKSSRQNQKQGESKQRKFKFSQEVRQSRRYGFFASTGIAGLLGAFLGAMLGGSFLLIWFSLTYSPFAPQE